MKHIKVFEKFEEGDSLRESRSDKSFLESIESICKKFGITNWTQNSDGLINVDGDVYLRDKGLTKLPLNFGRVTGHFNCYQNNLTTLKGAPKEVGGQFHCAHNQLTSLEGAPREVGGDFHCGRNNLIKLEGAPIRVGGNFDCFENNFTT